MISQSLRVLIIDDESTIREMLRTNLEAHKFEVAEAASGEEGGSVALSFHPHIIILDLGLPDINGLEVLIRLRKWTTIPVIVLTVSDDEKTKVQLLDAGADDFMTKPFSLPELHARIRVALRRHQVIEATPIYSSRGLEVDLNKKIVSLHGKPVKLTATEYEVLAHLVREAGKVVSQEKLLKEIWGPHSGDQGHYLRIYIGQLRKKIEMNSANPEYILTEPGVGYKIV